MQTPAALVAMLDDAGERDAADFALRQGLLVLSPDILHRRRVEERLLVRQDDGHVHRKHSLLHRQEAGQIDGPYDLSTQGIIPRLGALRVRDGVEEPVDAPDDGRRGGIRLGLPL